MVTTIVAELSLRGGQPTCPAGPGLLRPLGNGPGYPSAGTSRSETELMQ